jgi:hypothetical protein
VSGNPRRTPGQDAYRLAWQDLTATCPDGPRRGQMGPFEDLMEDRYNDGLAAGLIRPCPHFLFTDQLMWLPVEGGPVGCRLCVGLFGMTLGGSDEDTACDVCGVGPNVIGTFQERHLILRVAAPGFPDKALTIFYVVCASCLDREPGLREQARARRRP